jgi:putative DNA primase/helicase
MTGGGGKQDTGTGRAAALVAEAGIRLAADHKRICRLASDGPLGRDGGDFRTLTGEGWPRAKIDFLVKYGILEIVDIDGIQLAVLRGDPPPGPDIARRFARPGDPAASPAESSRSGADAPADRSGIREAIDSAPVVATPDDPPDVPPDPPRGGAGGGDGHGGGTGGGGGDDEPPGGEEGGGTGLLPDREPTRGEEGRRPDREEKVDWDLVERCAAEPVTDIGNGRRFLHRHGAEVIAVHRIGYFAFDTRRWAEDIEESRVRRLAHDTAEKIALETAFIKPTTEEQAAIEAAGAVMDDYIALRKKGSKRTPEEEKQLLEMAKIVDAGSAAGKAAADRRSRRRKYAVSSSNKGKLDGMLNEAKPYVGVDLADMDADPLAFNVGNGTLRFVAEPDLDCPDPDAERVVWAARLDRHDRTDMISKLCPVDFDPAQAGAPAFKAFLERVLPNPEVRRFIQRYLGYAMTALTREQVFVFFWGQGRNGKSTLVDLVCRIMGDYTTSVPFETLAGDDRRRGGEATPDLARLPATRLVRASEPEQRMKFRESMVKSLTSGEPIPIRRLHADFVDIYPTFKLIVSGNHKPSIEGTDEGIWRRVLLVPWEEQIPRDEIDRNLPEKLWAERTAILNWLVRGALDYLGNGLAPPDAVRAATDEYREESDPIGAFLRTACEITGNDHDHETPGDLYAGFEKYCKEAGLSAWQATTFTKRLPDKASQLGIRKAKTMGMTVYRGVRIRDAYRTAADPAHTQGGF